jgi:hypothetical protein
MYCGGWAARGTPWSRSEELFSINAVMSATRGERTSKLRVSRKATTVFESLPRPDTVSVWIGWTLTSSSCAPASRRKARIWSAQPASAFEAACGVSPWLVTDASQMTKSDTIDRLAEPVTVI